MPTVLCLNNSTSAGSQKTRLRPRNTSCTGSTTCTGADFRVVVCGDGTRRLLRWLQKLAEKARLPIQLGDLSQQSNTLSELRSADLIYSPCDSVVWGLCCLRAAGLLGVPVICLAHHPLLRGRTGTSVGRGSGLHPGDRRIPEPEYRGGRRDQSSGPRAGPQSSTPVGPRFGLLPAVQSARSGGRVGRTYRPGLRKPLGRRQRRPAPSPLFARPATSPRRSEGSAQMCPCSHTRIRFTTRTLN